MKNVFLIALKNLISEKGRLIITVGGAAFSVTLILTLLGLYLGWQAQMTQFIGTSTADLWIAQKGSRDMSHSVSLVPDTFFTKLENIAGITKIVPLIGRQVSFDKGGREVHLFLMGVDKNMAIRPYKLLEGKNFPSPGEVIIDKTFAASEHVKLGDTLTIKNNHLTVTGIMSGGNLMVYTYALANFVDVEQILNMRDWTNYYLINAAIVPYVKQQIEEQYSDIIAIERQTFLDYNSALLKETFLPIVEVLLVIAMLVGLAVIGLTIYTATIEKSREYGVLKAIGYTNFQLLIISLVQAITAGIIGYTLGILLTRGVVAVATQFTSSFIYELSYLELVDIFVLTVFISIIAAFIPLKRTISIDPAQVFKA